MLICMMHSFILRAKRFLHCTHVSFEVEYCIYLFFYFTSKAFQYNITGNENIKIIPLGNLLISHTMYTFFGV